MHKMKKSDIMCNLVRDNNSIVTGSTKIPFLTSKPSGFWLMAKLSLNT